jgi:hypothetical protein
MKNLLFSSTQLIHENKRLEFNHLNEFINKMGGDGGSIPSRYDLVDMYAKFEQRRQHVDPADAEWPKWCVVVPTLLGEGQGTDFGGFLLGKPVR